MKNLFVRFFTVLAAFFTAMFTPHYESGRMSKMNEHNLKTYQKLRERMGGYAEKFILPVCKRDKNGELIKNKKYLRYQRFIKERQEEFKLKRGHKVFFIEGERIVALNAENAYRKSERIKYLVLS